MPENWQLAPGGEKYIASRLFFYGQLGPTWLFGSGCWETQTCLADPLRVVSRLRLPFCSTFACLVALKQAQAPAASQQRGRAATEMSQSDVPVHQAFPPYPAGLKHIAVFF